MREDGEADRKRIAIIVAAACFLMMKRKARSTTAPSPQFRKGEVWRIAAKIDTCLGSGVVP